MPLARMAAAMSGQISSWAFLYSAFSSGLILKTKANRFMVSSYISPFLQ